MKNKNTTRFISNKIIFSLLFLLSINCAFSQNLAVTTKALAATSSSNLMGINLFFSYQDWCDDRMFADAMKTCRGPWYKPNAWGDPNPRANVDANFWPTEDACILVFDIKNSNGTYKVSFTGSASSITLSWGGGTIANKAYNSATNTTTCDLIATSGPINMQFTGTNGGIKNLKVMRPLTQGSTSSYPTTAMFTDQIKNLVSKFQVIRYMDYFQINSQNLATWNQRSLPIDASQNGFRSLPNSWGSLNQVGGCIEYAIMLSNETGTDMWLNIPHKVNDDFITKLAQLIKYGSDGTNPYTSTQANPVYPPLNSNLKVYVEWSNEVWNTAPGFGQGNDNHDAAIAEVNAGNSPLNYGGMDNNWFWAYRRVAKKLVETSNIFRTVFGDAAMMTRIRPCLEWQQHASPQELLMFIDQIYGKVTPWCSTPHPVNYYIYGGGGSAYYNPDNGSTSLTIDNIWTSETFNSATWSNICKIESSVVHAFGLKRIAYEGGPSMDKGGSDNIKALAINDPRMKTNMIDHFDNAWSATGSDLLVYYVTAGDFQWGFTTDIFNLNTPKLQAIDQLNTQDKVAATYGSVPPCTMNGTAADRYFSLNTSGWTSGTTIHQKQNAYIIYVFRVVTAGTYNVSANVGTNSGPLEIYYDGIKLGKESGTGNLPTYTMANLQPGVHAVMFKTTTGEVDLNTVTIGTGAGVITANSDNIASDLNNELVNVYPNPATDYVTIDLKNISNNENTTVKLSDLTGKVVYTNIVSDSKNLIVATNSFAKGIYILSISNGSKKYNQKLVIK